MESRMSESCILLWSSHHHCSTLLLLFGRRARKKEVKITIVRMNVARTRIRAIFTDMDRTLLNANHVISDYTKDVLRSIRRHNESTQNTKEKIYFILVTGRPYPDVIETVQKTDGLVADYIVSNNGACIFDASFRPIVQHCIPPTTVKTLLSLGVQFGRSTDKNSFDFATSWFQGKGWYTNHKIEGLGRSYPPHFQPQLKLDTLCTPEQVQATVEENALEGIPQIFYYGPHETLCPVEKELDRLKDHVDFCFSLPFILDISPHGINKGTAVSEVLSLLGLTPSESVAFGDGMNDLPMLQAVATPCVMQNSMEALFAALPEATVIGHHDEDGVAKKVVELFEIKL
ncbi:haloacid dehalogenase-like hydrolase [Angomonas deanei]|nr:haloacid dehalogenase-like hydrolase [Angomonas deanei]|eukprot:EPY29095.1 haloacid dehalogenase-like hydrolase [Angomonas deanei]